MTQPYTLTITLDAEEEELIQELARARGLHEPTEVIHALLIEAYDALWDKKFEESQDFLAQMAHKVRAQIAAGETEDCDSDDNSDVDGL